MEQIQDIAIFGGTFDPPTLAHEAIIRHCLLDERLAEVWCMPSGTRSDKPSMQADAVRLRLLEVVRREVFASAARLTISSFELQLPRPTQTIQTYQALREAYPDTRFWFVFGADTIANMHTWQGGAYLRAHLPILAIPREGYSLPPENERLRYVADDPLYLSGISSTEVRRRIAASEPYAHLVGAAVAERIKCDKLYV